MPFIPEEILEQIRQRSDIVDVVSQFVPLKKRGADYWGCCPFHHERTPSFKVNPERGVYYCFGCKEHGEIFQFVKSMLNTDFPGAARWLADRAGITIPETTDRGISPDQAARLRQQREKRQALLESAAKWFHSHLSHPEAQVARNYLNGRGLDKGSIEQFQLGYSPDKWDALIQWATAIGYTMDDLLATGLVAQNDELTRTYDRFRGRLIFPIWNENGKVCGFSARLLDAEAKAAKYVNSPETEFFQKGRLLYAMNFARPKLKETGYALICEGQLDVIACHRAGINCAVAAEGTAFTAEHAALLKKSVRKIVLCFDADGAGYKAAERTIRLLHEQDFEVQIVTLPSGEDPDSIFRTGGAPALQPMLSVREEAIPYLLRIARESADENTPNGKSVIVNRVLAAVQPLTDQIVRTAHCQFLAKSLSLPETVVFQTLEAISNSAARQQPRQPVFRPQMSKPLFFHRDTPDEKLWRIVLDLILHYEKFIPQLEQELAEDNILPNSPLGQAINYVILFYNQDEWNTSADQIQKMQIFQDNNVGRVIAESEFSPNEPNAERRAELAFQDCLAKIQLCVIGNAIARKKAELAQQTDDETCRTIQQEITQLLRKKQAIATQHGNEQL